MKIGIVGGGVNGLCCAWVLAQKGHVVSLYEKDKLVSKTSRSSSKLLHGGLRYLEQGSFRLVKEALKERDAWLQRVPSLTSPVRLVLPVYSDSGRSRWLLKVGLFLYDNLARSNVLPQSKWLDKKEICHQDPQLKAENLMGGYEFSDGQMDDYKLGLWVAEKAQQAGCDIFEDTPVNSIDKAGNLYLNGSSSGITLNYDCIINVCGPWAINLLEKSKIETSYTLDLVRGSHLIINIDCPQAYLFEVPNEKRIFFVLPWKKHTLLGTTEVRQAIDDPIECSEQERDYLLAAYNHYHVTQIKKEDVLESFAGVRPLLSSAKDPSQQQENMQ